MSPTIEEQIEGLKHTIAEIETQRESADVSFRIPHTYGMATLELYHNDELIFIKDLPPGLLVWLPMILNNRLRKGEMRSSAPHAESRYGKSRLFINNCSMLVRDY